MPKKLYYFEQDYDTLEDLYVETHGKNVRFKTGFPNFLSEIKEFETPIPIKRPYQHYQTTVAYECSQTSFIRGFMWYQNTIQTPRRKEWTEANDLQKLIACVEEAFDRNRKAHNCSKRFAKWNAFDKKSDALRDAVYYAQQIIPLKLDGFSWGKQFDNGAHDHPWIIYFQFDADQVSFHSYEMEDVPLFEGKWIGVPQEKCPNFYNFLKKQRGIAIPSHLRKDFPKILTEAEVLAHITQPSRKETANNDADFTEEEIEAHVQQLKASSLGMFQATATAPLPKKIAWVQKTFDTILQERSK